MTNELPLRPFELYDATLRDGMQGEGMALSAEEKLRVAKKLDELGVQLIEAGFPASNPKEQEVFALLAQETWTHAQIAAFGMTRRRDLRADQDPSLRILADCFCDVTTIVGKTWSLHLEKVVRVDPAENLKLIEDSVAFLVGEGKRVIYDAEHFFDAWRADREYAHRCLRAAVEAGADTLTLCDTNGSTLPHQIHEAVSAVVAELGTHARIGIHAHDDGGCGVANSLMAVQAGSTHVQGTTNGIGERTGNANLTTITADLELKMGIPALPPGHLTKLTETAHFVDELLNRVPSASQPYVGRNAFAHKGGLHIAGIRADATTFEHVAPEAVGNAREILMSELAGKGTVLEAAESAGIEVDDAQAARVIERVKQLEHEGYQFEAADGSFELLLRRETGTYEPLFRLESWRVIVEQRAGGTVETEATIKIWIGDERFVRTAEGNGPVHALDQALRSAISAVHPHIAEIELTDFKVRILDSTRGTGATTRVLLDATDGHDTWGSLGVNENVIAASWDALVDSLARNEQVGRRGVRPEATTAP
ncbi:MAG: citramalate synthase [Patulibacter sp.]